MNAAAVPLLNVPDDEGAEGTDHSGHGEIDFFAEDIVRAPPAPIQGVDDDEEEDQSGLLARFQLLCGHIESERVRGVYKEMIRLEANQLELRTLEAWMEEKDGAPPHDFSMRWVVVKGAHFLWSNKKLMVTDTRDEDERSRWNECVHLMMISGVSEGASEREFRFNVETFGDNPMTRQFVWKAKTKKQWDYWVEGLQEHVQS